MISDELEAGHQRVSPAKILGRLAQDVPLGGQQGCSRSPTPRPGHAARRARPATSPAVAGRPHRRKRARRRRSCRSSGPVKRGNPGGQGASGDPQIGRDPTQAGAGSAPVELDCLAAELLGVGLAGHDRGSSRFPGLAGFSVSKIWGQGPYKLYEASSTTTPGPRCRTRRVRQRWSSDQSGRAHEPGEELVELVVGASGRVRATYWSGRTTTSAPPQRGRDRPGQPAVVGDQPQHRRPGMRHDTMPADFHGQVVRGGVEPSTQIVRLLVVSGSDR